MKITALSRNDRGQLLADVVSTGKELRIFADRWADLPKNIVKACHFTSYDEVKMDLQLNYSDFK
jgi:hypothetical protein